MPNCNCNNRPPLQPSSSILSMPFVDYSLPLNTESKKKCNKKCSKKCNLPKQKNHVICKNKQIDKYVCDCDNCKYCYNYLWN